MYLQYFGDEYRIFDRESLRAHYSSTAALVQQRTPRAIFISPVHTTDACLIHSCTQSQGLQRTYAASQQQ